MSRVALIGAGPGDPELLTRKAWRIVGEADVILYDALMDAPGMFELAPGAQWVAVGKRANQASIPQALICRMLVNYARQGLKVVRLKGVTRRFLVAWPKNLRRVVPPVSRLTLCPG
ncbi:uroporphyrinogen-III C-methyltransferase [Neopusillimonas aromaticivorans]|uniref:uroporphyrinogen-III C-methyltransferase n=1 Tax=Neopusillimonas aromaticivorans TaxID=2979868 RepID=UPI002598A0A4|nr:SAM-dependent methyltransferase [Neopusillimonas aromaticivorans]WJJ92677.1 SAM-dependent methyltransferase [Neopusillimonas aromaticivorans]